MRGKTITRLSLALKRNQSMGNCKMWLSTNMEVSEGVFTPDVVCATPSWEGDELALELSHPYTLTDNGIYVGVTAEALRLNSDIQKPYTVCKGHRLGGLLVHGSRTSTDRFADHSAAYILPMHVRLSGTWSAYAGHITAVSDQMSASGDDITINAGVSNWGFEEFSTLEFGYDMDGSTGIVQAALDQPLTTEWNTVRQLQVTLPPCASKGKHSLRLWISSVEGQACHEFTDTAVAAVHVVGFVPVKRPLFEEYTNLRCGNCPRGLAAMEELALRYGDRFVAMGYHSWSHNDPMAGIGNDLWPSAVNAFPHGELDRRPVDDVYFGTSGEPLGIEADWLAQRDSLCFADVKVDAALEGTVVKINADVRFVDDVEAGWHLAYYLLEDDMHDPAWCQTNYYIGDGRYADDPYLRAWEEMPAVVTDYHCSDIMIYTPDSHGEELPECVAEETLTRQASMDFSTVLNPKGEPVVRDTGKLRVVAALTRPDGVVENCNAAPVRIEEDNISIPEADRRGVQLYDLTGRKVENPSRGIYVTSDGRKIAI